jgi:hypothetical protein
VREDGFLGMRRKMMKFIVKSYFGNFTANLNESLTLKISQQ